MQTHSFDSPAFTKLADAASPAASLGALLRDSVDLLAVPFIVRRRLLWAV
jgi:hypothetical protein